MVTTKVLGLVVHVAPCPVCLAASASAARAQRPSRSARSAASRTTRQQHLLIQKLHKTQKGTRLAPRTASRAANRWLGS